MEKDLLNIINNYGVLNQLKHFQSEVYELTEAIFDYEYTDRNEELEKKLKEHMEEEIADNLNFINQFIEYYNIDRTVIDLIMNQKIKRQLGRIEKESGNNENKM